MESIRQHIHLSCPFSLLVKKHLDEFLREKIQPEITFDAETLDGPYADRIQWAAAKLHDAGLSVTIHAPFIDMSPGSLDPWIREAMQGRLNQVLDLVRIFRPRSVVCHAGFERIRYGFFRKQWNKKAQSMFSWFGEALQKEGSRLVLENVYEDGPNDIRFLFEALADQNVGFCLDAGHATVFSKCSLDQWLDGLGLFIAQVHLHDNYGTYDNHIAPGKGIIQIPKVIRYLKKRISPAPIITLEPHQEKDGKYSIQYIEELWAKE